jgi:hypothetical protein
MAKPCALTGTNLFLVASIAATPDFDNAAEVPPEFTGTQLSVPHPVNSLLYLRLRDDPDTVQGLVLPVQPASQAGSQAAAFQAQPAAVEQQSNQAVGRLQLTEDSLGLGVGEDDGDVALAFGANHPIQLPELPPQHPQPSTLNSQPP